MSIAGELSRIRIADEASLAELKAIATGVVSLSERVASLEAVVRNIATALKPEPDVAGIGVGPGTPVVRPNTPPT
jgi:hypothetical protein